MNVRCRTKMCAVRASNFIVCFKKKILLLDLSLPCVGYLRLLSFRHDPSRSRRIRRMKSNRALEIHFIFTCLCNRPTDTLWRPYNWISNAKLYRRYRQKLIATQKICKFDFTTFFRSILKKSGRRRLKCLKSSGGKPLHQGPG